VAASLANFQRDERRHAMPQSLRIDVWPITGDHASAMQPVKTCLHCAACDLQPARPLEHPDAGFGGEQLDDPRV
jgi:hypothetical protein